MAQEYSYRAVNIEGRTVSGRIQASSPEDANARLFGMNLAPLEVHAAQADSASGPMSGQSRADGSSPKGGFLSGLFGGGEGQSGKAAARREEAPLPGAAPRRAVKGERRERRDENAPGEGSFMESLEKAVLAPFRKLVQGSVPTPDLVLFTKQFRTLYRAGISLPEVFSVLASQTDNKRLRAAAAGMEASIREGESIRRAFGKHPGIFSRLYLAMIDAGEKSGAIISVLDRLVYLLEHEAKVKSKVESALRYPKMVLGVMAGAFIVLLNYVVPQFANVYMAARVDLPLPTQIALEMNRWMSEYTALLVIVVIALVVVARAWLMSSAGVLMKDRWVLKVPVIGPLVQKAALARFAAIFSILQQSGVTIIESMDVLKDTLDNAYFRSQFDEAKQRMRAGGGIADSLGRIDGFTPLAVSLLVIGEKSSHLEEMMDELANHYDSEVEMQVDRLTEYLGPALILCLGVVVLFFALAIFLPMWDLVKFVK